MTDKQKIKFDFKHFQDGLDYAGIPYNERDPIITVLKQCFEYCDIEVID